MPSKISGKIPTVKPNKDNCEKKTYLTIRQIIQNDSDKEEQTKINSINKTPTKINSINKTPSKMN